MGEQMKLYNTNKYRFNKPFYIFTILFLLTLLVFITRTYIPNEISILNNEQTNVNLSSHLFSFDSESDSVIVNTTTDKKMALSNKGTLDDKITVKFLGIPIKSTDVRVINTNTLIPSGQSVGINIKTDGVMVLGTGAVTDKDGKICKPWENKLKPKDILLKVNGTSLNSKEELTKIITSSQQLDFLVKRENQEINISVTPVIALSDNSNKIGIWVRDGTEGIGTLTYINPTTKMYGALGHGVLDVDTSELMPVKTGSILKSNISTINKGVKGSPGELIGIISTNELGNVKKNTSHGLYGEYTETIDKDQEMVIGLKEDIKIGEAFIMCNLGEGVQKYSINIEDINLKSLDEKSMIIKITDTNLLSKTNGIIQGMSGSPIIQDDKIIGAVTHVFVQDPTKGYGIFIENMLNEEKQIS